MLMTDTQRQTLTAIRDLLSWNAAMPQTLHHRDADALFCTIETALHAMVEAEPDMLVVVQTIEQEQEDAFEADPEAHDMLSVFDEDFWDIVESRLSA